MLTRKELKELAHDVLTETLHGSVPMNTVAELAAGVGLTGLERLDLMFKRLGVEVVQIIVAAERDHALGRRGDGRGM